MRRGRCRAKDYGMSNNNRKQETERNTREKDRQAQKKHLDEKLDEALDGTFPASDPIEIAATTD
jgi:hypothetical protein